jgi:hypothetical protein
MIKKRFTLLEEQDYIYILDKKLDMCIPPAIQTSNPKCRELAQKFCDLYEECVLEDVV